MAQPYKKRKYGDSKPSKIMAIDRPISKGYRRKTTEQKWFDTSISATAMDAAGTVLSASLNLVSEGNAPNEMAGRKIVITRIQMRLTVISPANTNASLTGLTTDPQYRFVIAQDRQCNGATASIPSIFQNTEIRSFNNLSNSRRFKIIKDITETINQVMTFNTNTLLYAAGDGRDDHEFYIKCFIPVMFSEQSGGSRVIGEVLSNNIFVFGFSSSSSVTATYRARIRFMDD